MTQNELPKWRVEATLDAHFNANNIWELKKLARKTERSKTMEKLNGIISRIKEKNFEAYIYNSETVATIDILRNRKGNAEVWTRYYIEPGVRSRRLGFVRYLNDCFYAWDLNDGSAEEIIDWLKRDIECDIFDRI